MALLWELIYHDELLHIPTFLDLIRLENLMPLLEAVWIRFAIRSQSCQNKKWQLRQLSSSRRAVAAEAAHRNDENDMHFGGEFKIANSAMFDVDKKLET